ncbi:MAG: hypothetical protein ACP5GZ_12115, partial [Vulcanisaeta sp.]|uniref:hypothetical protein n=1 Tax=Vulcanisaeta sp. TaxID=2020871 RepID=UPI003D126EA9
VIGNVYPAPLPDTSIELSVKQLRSGGKTSIQAFNVSILGFGGGLAFKESLQRSLQINSQVFYQEAASAWIICVGNGHFIRLFDEPWNLNIISNKDIEDRAFVINHYVEGVSGASRIKR